MNSMTGFGKAEISRTEYTLRVELASVNSRYLECIFRMPRTMAGFEGNIKELVNREISRGKITITVNLEESPEFTAESTINIRTAKAYYKRLREIQKELKVPGQITIEQLLLQPQLLSSGSETIDESGLWSDLEKLVLKAIKGLKKMRAAEGANLRRDMAARIKNVKKMVQAIERQSPHNVDAYRQRLDKRIQDLSTGIELDPRRLAEEVTIFADRSDVSEECTRLYSHLDLFAQTLKSAGDAGKRLNFILQEMGREANTVSSKSLSNATSTHAIELKEEIEKLREQAQNIE